MRDPFLTRIVELSKNDGESVVLTANFLNPYLDPLKEKGLLFDIGIAEQNLILMATGLSSLNFKSFLLSAANFPTLRTFEHLRNIPNRYNSNVKIVAIGSGFGSTP
jgi:transketolase